MAPKNVPISIVTANGMEMPKPILLEIDRECANEIEYQRDSIVARQWQIMWQPLCVFQENIFSLTKAKFRNLSINKCVRTNLIRMKNGLLILMVCVDIGGLFHAKNNVMHVIWYVWSREILQFMAILPIVSRAFDCLANLPCSFCHFPPCTLIDENCVLMDSKMRLMWMMCCGGRLNQRMQLHLFHKYLFISKKALILIRREKSLLNCVWVVLKSHLIIWSTFRTQLIVENNICDIFGCIALLSHHLVVHFSDCFMLLSEYIREM